jgi:hypothetical protein
MLQAVQPPLQFLKITGQQRRTCHRAWFMSDFLLQRLYDDGKDAE